MAEGTLIELDGVKTYLVDSGGSSLALLLIHGSGPGIDGAWSWTPVLPELNKRYRTIAVDSPGYGESEMLPGVRVKLSFGKSRGSRDNCSFTRWP